MIDNIDLLISELNKRLHTIVKLEFNLDLVEKEGNLKVFQTHGRNTALNRLDDGHSGEVSVYNWFGDYYIFIEIKFLFGVYVPSGKKKTRSRIEQTSISISVFKKISDVITQFFRADWDDFVGDKATHPQPHWHFTADTAISKTFEEYAQEFKNEDFLSLIEPKKEEISELKAIHFAMNAQWAKQNTYKHSIDSKEDVINWISGVLEMIRKEIEYAHEA